MTKKFLCVIVLMLALVCVLASCGNDECKHQWSDITCIYDGRCEKCGETVGTGLGHDYSEWIETNNCISDGSKERSCNRCGKKETETIYARGYHSFGLWETTTAANCLQAGVEERICADCGEKETQSLSKKNHHRYEDYVCLDCGKQSEFCINLPSTPLTTKNWGNVKGTYTAEEYRIDKIEATVVEWTQNGTCKVKISLSGEKTYATGKDYYLTDEISFEISGNGKTIYEDIHVGSGTFSEKSITLELNAEATYTITINKSNIYV